jgi:predicted heme/steroid binding protein
MSAFSGRVINTSDAITWQSVAQHKALHKAQDKAVTA